MVDITIDPAPSPDIIFTGDVANAHSGWASPAIGPGVRSIIDDANIAVTNLEAAMATGDPIEKRGSTIATDAASHRRLQSWGFNGVTLANNHVMDYGPPGMHATIDSCTEVGLQTVGAGVDIDDAMAPMECEVAGVSVGIFAVTEHAELVATEDTPGTCWSRTPAIAATIDGLTDSFDITILVAHGGIEYVPIPPPSWRRLLRGFTSLDIDAVVAHHPHCPQGWEIHNDTPIVYSLGNFLLRNERIPATKRSIGVGFDIDEARLQDASIIPFEVSDEQVRLTNSDDDDFSTYLRGASEMLHHNQGYHQTWHALATELFQERYEHIFDDYGRYLPSSLVSNPIQALDRATKRCFGPCARASRQRSLLDFVVNESHRDLVTTVLEHRLRGGDGPREMDAVPALDAWYPFYDGRPTRDWLSRQRYRVRKLLERR